MADRTNKEIKTGRFIATASIVFSILLIIHYFVSLDNATAKALLNLTNQNTSDKAIDYILNSFRFTGIMYILAYLAGFITFGIDILMCGGLCLQFMYQIVCLRWLIYQSQFKQ